MMQHPLIWTTVGFILWSALFIILYAVQATGCHLGWHQVLFIGELSLLRVVMLLLLSVAFVMSLLVYRQAKLSQVASDDGRTRSFFLEVGTYVWFAALAAIPLCFAGVGLLKLCGT